MLLLITGIPSAPWSKVTEVVFVPKSPKLRCIDFIDGIVYPYSLRHDVFKVMIPDGEAWVFDPSTSQFGYPDFLLPWHDYLSNRVTKILFERELGCAQHERPPPLRSRPAMWLADLVEKEIPKLGQAEHGGEMSALAGSDAKFTDVKAAYLESVERFIQNCVANIYNHAVNRWEDNRAE
jgi:hypothetical protein